MRPDLPGVTAALLSALREVSPAGIGELGVSELRRLRGFARFEIDPIQQLVVEDHELPSPTGHGIKLRVYLPHETTAPPSANLFLHGGGWVRGDLEDVDPICRFIAYHSELPVVSSNYRLAPEHPYPAALLDVLRTIEWARNQAFSLGGLGIIGESAGGNLAAAATALIARMRWRQLDYQVLVYPVLDATMSAPSWPQLGELTPSADYHRRCINWYLQTSGLEDCEYVSPSLMSDATGLPPTLVLTAEFDPLYAEGADYVKLLQSQGVEANLRSWPHMIHGFLHMATETPEAKSALREITTWVRARAQVSYTTPPDEDIAAHQHPAEDQTA